MIADFLPAKRVVARTAFGTDDDLFARRKCVFAQCTMFTEEW
jgi:hypothetical protein